jgi:hypothetical protein
MSAEKQFIKHYPKVDISLIEVEWNGRMGTGFEDANQYFRERIIKEIDQDNSSSMISLKQRLFLEEAKWAKRALSYRYYLTDLSKWLIEKDLKGSLDVLVEGFTDNMISMNSVLDLTITDDQIDRLLTNLRPTIASNEAYLAFYNQLEALIQHKEESKTQAEAFEAYVTYKEKPAEAAHKSIKMFFRESSTEIIALLVVIPCALLLGYYWFGISILIGLIPIALAIGSIFLMYKIATFIIR